MRLRRFLPAIALASLAGCVAAIDTPPPDPSPSAADAGAAAVAPCLAAIAKQTGHPRDKVKLLVSRARDGKVEVFAMVPGGEAPWQCRATPAGAVENVLYTGSEGAL